MLQPNPHNCPAAPARADVLVGNRVEVVSRRVLGPAAASELGPSNVGFE
jgi:hypothetical protein